MTTIDEAAESLAPEAPCPRSRPSWTPSRVFVYFIALALALAVTTSIYAGPVATSCGTTIFGAPGDATAGGVFTAWEYEHGVGPWPSRTEYNSAPYGESAWRPYFLSALTVQAPIKALDLVMGPVCSWNVAVFSGFVASGLAMAALAFYVTNDAVAATFAAFAFAFMPSRFMRAMGHIAYVHTEFLPLLLLAILYLCARPSWRRAVLVGVALALLGYTDGYYILIGGVTFAAAAAVLAVQALRSNQLARARLRGLVGAALVGCTLMLPLAGIFVGGREDLTTTVTREREEIDQYAARPVEYVLPSRSHPVFDEVFGHWQDTHRHGSNYTESTIYVGWVALLLAGYAVVRTWRQRRQRDELIHEGLSRRFPVLMLGTVAAVAFIFSLPATMHLFGVDVPGPSGVVYAFIKYWRVYARFAYTVHAAVIALAAIGLALLLRGRRRPVRWASVAVLIAVVLFESLVMPPRETWSYDQAAGAYKWLGAQTAIETIAEYPMHTPTGDPNGAYFTYQPVHGKKMVNARFASSDWDGVHAAITGLGDADTLPVLRAMGVDAVLVHPGLYTRSPAEPIPDELELIGSFNYAQDAERANYSSKKYNRWAYLAPYHNVDVYRIKPGRVAEVALNLGSGFYEPDQAGWKATRWLQDEATFDVRRLSGDAETARVSLSAWPAFDEPRHVQITQDGKTLWSGNVDAPATPIEFVAAVGKPITVTATPGDEKISRVDPRSADPREIALGVSDFVVSPADA